MKFRKLNEDEIDVRIGTITQNGCSLLLYKDARVDMQILDETGLLWQRRHYECKGNLFCSVGIKIDNEWIWKDDCGAESRTEKEKGESSDSFKRACVNWGIGRELYTAPFIWVPSTTIIDGKLTESYSSKETNGKLVIQDKFFVRKITYHEDKIDGLIIQNRNNGMFVFIKKPLEKEELKVS